MALLESTFENSLSFVEKSRFYFFIIMFGGKKALPLNKVLAGHSLLYSCSKYSYISIALMVSLWVNMAG